MSEQDHKISCRLSKSAHDQALAAFTAKWPNYCRACNGHGEIVKFDTVPYGSTTATMDNAEWCPECVGDGKCPRCGQEHGTGWCNNSIDPCEFCCFAFGDHLHDYPPDPWECSCWVADEEIEEEVMTPE